MAATDLLLLVIDASLSKRLAGELRNRGRKAVSLAHLGLAGLKDEPLLRELAKLYVDEPWVLVTADDAMPAAHASTIAELKVTVATLQPCLVLGPDAEAWKREIVHRWAHKMADQRGGTIRRYAPRGHRPWIRPRK